MLVSATALPGLRGWAINDGIRASAHTYVRTVVMVVVITQSDDTGEVEARGPSHLRRMSTS
jgi:hypothetical protein